MSSKDFGDPVVVYNTPARPGDFGGYVAELIARAERAEGMARQFETYIGQLSADVNARAVSEAEALAIVRRLIPTVPTHAGAIVEAVKILAGAAIALGDRICDLEHANAELVLRVERDGAGRCGRQRCER